MKTRKVEIEIPEDMEVLKVRNHSAQVRAKRRHDLVVELIQREPRRWIFEEIIGKREVSAGDYWMNTSGFVIRASSEYPIGDGSIPLRKIEE